MKPFLLGLLVGISLPVYAKTAYVLDNAADSVIGSPTSVISEYQDTLLDIARRHGLGYQDIKLLNPELDTWLPGKGKKIQLPLQFILPDARRKGLVLNIPEMRLYYFSRSHDGKAQVETYPLGVGREGWSTPILKTKIIEKKENPKWYPPESIRKEHEEAGDPLPKVVEAGPDNPLGSHAMRLGVPEYLIHGTNKPFGIGMRVSHGCIRLYPEDIAHLFSKVKLGTSVEIVNQPFKVGKLNHELFLEMHPYLDEDSERFQDTLSAVIELIVAKTGEDDYRIDWEIVRKEASSPSGLPIRIGQLNQAVEVRLATNEDSSLKTASSIKPEPLTPREDLTDKARNNQEDKLKKILEQGIELRLDGSLNVD